MEASDSGLSDVIGRVRKRGVKLWAINGQLHYRAPKGVLTDDELETLRESKNRVVALLEGGADAAEGRAPLGVDARYEYAPLTFSQLAHWHSYKLSARPSARFVASATRMHGRLNVDFLARSIAEVVRRHDALRTQVVIVNGAPTLAIHEASGCALRIDDLSSLAEESREEEVKRLFELEMFQPINVAVDPLTAMRLLRLDREQHVLIVTMEHMISDGISMNILLRDLFTAYVQILRGREVSFSVMPERFLDYAMRQRVEQSSWIKRHESYWNEHLHRCPPLQFPKENNDTRQKATGLGLVPVLIGKTTRKQLREWCRFRKTTLVMATFTAFIALVLRWCDAKDAVIQYQTDGRFSPDLQSTVGYFAFRLYLRVQLSEEDTFVGLTKRVTEEYCRAYEHADFSFMQAQEPRPPFTRSACFNWLPLDPMSDYFDGDYADAPLICSRIPFESRVVECLEADTETMMGLLDVDDEIRGVVQFPLSRYSSDLMELFSRNFQTFIQALLNNPEGRVKDVPLRRAPLTC